MSTGYLTLNDVAAIHTGQYWPKKLKFTYGHKVHRVGKSYRYPGVVVGFALTKKSQVRYIVEASKPGYEGMLHIFSEDELELNPTGE